MMKGLRSVGLIAAAGLALSSTTAFADELRIVSWGGAPPQDTICLLYTSPSPRDRQKTRMPSSA